MVSKFQPDIDRVYFINQYTLFQVLEGDGGIQVDFNNYYDWQNKIIYLEKGQYIRFFSGNFVVRKIIFPDEAVCYNRDVRVLFKHLISLGYIHFSACAACKKHLSATVFSSALNDIMNASSEQWFWQNPFGAKKEEYHLIFDLKDIIDQEYQNQLSSEELASLTHEGGGKAGVLLKNKVGLSVKGLLQNKRLLESKRKIAFTDESIQTISYDSGYKDPAYFNRVFRKQTGKSPKQFRADFDYEDSDKFTEDLRALLHQHHTTQHQAGFYARKLHMSVSTLSKKVKNKMQASLGQLIRSELIQTAKTMLNAEASIKETAYRLGFDEPHHFSGFFKHYTGITPSEFQKKSTQSTC